MPLPLDAAPDPLINRPVDDILGMPEVDNFYLDANGILQVAAAEKSSGKSETITIKAEKGRLSDDEIEDAIKLADSGGDGEVDYDEFIQFVLSD